MVVFDQIAGLDSLREPKSRLVIADAIGVQARSPSCRHRPPIARNSQNAPAICTTRIEALPRAAHSLKRRTRFRVRIIPIHQADKRAKYLIS